MLHPEQRSIHPPNADPNSKVQLCSSKASIILDPQPRETIKARCRRLAARCWALGNPCFALEPPRSCREFTGELIGMKRMQVNACMSRSLRSLIRPRVALLHSYTQPFPLQARERIQAVQSQILVRALGVARGRLKKHRVSNKNENETGKMGRTPGPHDESSTRNPKH